MYGIDRADIHTYMHVYQAVLSRIYIMLEIDACNSVQYIHIHMYTCVRPHICMCVACIFTTYHATEKHVYICYI